MILCNTTFHVEASADKLFHNWIKDSFLPHTADHGLTQPLFTRIISDDTDARCYAVQFRANDMEHINNWMENHGNRLITSIVEQSSQRILPFTTLMEIL